MRAAGLPPMSTVGEPMMIVSGGPTQVHMSPMRAAGRPPIRTVGAPGGRIGPPTCGFGPSNIGHVCMSVMRAAGGIAPHCPGRGGDVQPSTAMTPEELARKADTAGLRLVRFLWCGNDGTIRAKASSRHGLEGRLTAGIGVTAAMEAMNSLDQLQPVPNMGPVGEVRLVPDLSTLRTLPYAPHTGALLADQMGLDGLPAPVCQRSFLKRMQAKLSEQGFALRAAFENEFSLAT